MMEEKASLGGEENGGVIIGDNQYCRDGGMTLAKVLDIMAMTEKPLSALIGELPRYILLKKSMETEGRPWSELKKKLLSAFPDNRRDETDGLKIFFEDGWSLIRPSGTESIVRVYVNSKNEKAALILQSMVLNALKP
jgi:phosphomannomutase/phosphoglucomutase